MDSGAFIRWALDPRRTIEERYTVELLVEDHLPAWHAKHQTQHYSSWQEQAERNRQRALNPGYEPCYLAEDVERATEILAERNYWHHASSFHGRLCRDLAVLRFLPQLEDLQLDCATPDCSPVGELPRLRKLKFSNATGEDLRPLMRCTGLRELSLQLNTHWPDLTGFEALQQLEELHLTGNLLALPPGLNWPLVRRGTLKCEPLALRSVRELPQLPNCEFLTLKGVERLDGIEAWPRLRNLTVEGVVRDFAPLTALPELTWFSHFGAEPLDVTPLAQLPKLQCVHFRTQHKYAMDKMRPRDYAPLAEAPLLRELHVEGCPPVEAEVKNLNALLLPWDDALLAAPPRPMPAFQMFIASMEKHPRRPDLEGDAAAGDLADEGLRACEGRWVGRFLEKLITEKLGQADWGNARADGMARSFFVTIQSYAVVEKLPVIVAALREAMSRLRHEYEGQFMISLIAPAVIPTPAQLELEKKLRAAEDDEDFERRHREYQEYLDRLHRYELKRQAGLEVSPNEFAPPPPPEATAPPPAPTEENWQNDDADADGEIATEIEVPEPSGSFLDNEHPLADEYRLLGRLSLNEVWFLPHHRDLAIYLMGRPPDAEIPAEKPS